MIEKKDFIKLKLQFLKNFQEEKCMHPDHSTCQGVIIRSHTIQKNKALRTIEENGHVYSLIQKTLTGSIIKLHSEGINEASTFNGFCKYHDNELFKCIDDYDFIPTDEQVFMITYRTLAREAYQKQAALNNCNHNNEIIDKIKNPIQKNEIQKDLEAHKVGIVIGEKELASILSKMFVDYQNKNYSKIKYYLIKTKNFSNVLTSGFFTPDFDYDYNPINDSFNQTHWISLNIFSDTKNGLILFSWLEDFKSEQFVKSLLNTNDYLNKTIELAFTNIENTYFSKKWWNSLKTVKTNRIYQMSENDNHYDENGNYTGIRKNNLKYQDLEIDCIKTNVKSLMQIAKTITI